MKTLAEQQAALMAALTGQADAPPGFDASRISASARALRHKRMRGVLQTWPQLHALLCGEFDPLFAEYAASHPQRAHGGPLADGRAFVHWLDHKHPLNDAVRRQALEVDVRHVLHADGCRLRHTPAVRAAWWPESGRWAIVFCWPGVTERHWRFRLWRRR